jgi:hypothetical protein
MIAEDSAPYSVSKGLDKLKFEKQEEKYGN